jgi:predicted double-glycine peptidase
MQIVRLDFDLLHSALTTILNNEVTSFEYIQSDIYTVKINAMTFNDRVFSWFITISSVYNGYVFVSDLSMYNIKDTDLLTLYITTIINYRITNDYIKYFFVDSDVLFYRDILDLYENALKCHSNN